MARLPMPPDIHYVNCRRIVQQPTGHDADAGLIGQAAKFPDHRVNTAFQLHFELHRNCRSLDFPWDASIFSLRSSLIQNAGAGVPAPGMTARVPCRRSPNRARKRAPTTSRSPGAVASRPSHQLPNWSRNFRGTSSARGWTASHCFTADTIAACPGVFAFTLARQILVVTSCARTSAASMPQQSPTSSPCSQHMGLPIRHTLHQYNRYKRFVR